MDASMAIGAICIILLSYAVIATYYAITYKKQLLDLQKKFEATEVAITFAQADDAKEARPRAIMKELPPYEEITMTLQEKLTNALHSSRDRNLLRILRVAVAELQREPTKQVTNERTIRILKKLIANEKELPAQDHKFISVLEAFLPEEATDEEISQWINKNIDFTAFNNKMQAMGPIMEQFSGRADGNRVKKILQGFE